MIPAALILGERAIAGGGHTPGRFAAELTAYAVAVVVSTVLLEHRLLREMLGYLRKRLPASPDVVAE